MTSASIESSVVGLRSESSTACAYGSSNASSAAPRSRLRRAGSNAEAPRRLVGALGCERRCLGRGEPLGEMLLHPRTRSTSSAR